MKSDLLRLEPKHFGDGHLIHCLKLGRNPGLGAITVESHRSVEWFHRRMREVWKFIFGDDSIRSRNSLKRLFIPARDGDITGRAHEIFVFAPQPRAVRLFNSRQIPIDLQTVARLLRRPESIRDYRHAAAFCERNLKYFPHSINRASILVVEALHFSAEYRWVGHHRDLHSRQIEIKSELLRSVALRSAVKTPNRFANEPKL